MPVDAVVARPVLVLGDFLGSAVEGGGGGEIARGHRAQDPDLTRRQVDGLGRCRPCCSHKNQRHPDHAAPAAPAGTILMEGLHGNYGN